MSLSILKNPSAWLPVAMSLGVLVVMIVSILAYGVPARQPDEGTGAHLFQIWLGLEVLMIVFFCLKWLPRLPKQSLIILAIQILTVLLPVSVVFLLKL